MIVVLNFRFIKKCMRASNHFKEINTCKEE